MSTTDSRRSKRTLPLKKSRARPLLLKSMLKLKPRSPLSFPQSLLANSRPSKQSVLLLTKRKFNFKKN